MNIDPFWLGVLTPFAIFIGIAVVGLLAAALIWAWSRIDKSLWYRVDLKKNLADFDPNGGAPKNQVEYMDAANKIRDALLKSPRFYNLHAFGWVIVFVRNWHNVTKFDPSEQKGDQ